MNPLTQAHNKALAEFNKEFVTRYDKESVAINVADENDLVDLNKHICGISLALVEALDGWIAEETSANGCGCELCDARLHQLEKLQTLLTTFKQELTK